MGNRRFESISLQRGVACEPEPLTLALFAFAYGVCYGATIALRPAVIADHFAGPDLAAVTGLHYTSSVLGRWSVPQRSAIRSTFGTAI